VEAAVLGSGTVVPVINVFGFDEIGVGFYFDEKNDKK